MVENNIIVVKAMVSTLVVEVKGEVVEEKEILQTFLQRVTLLSEKDMPLLLDSV